MDYKEKYEQALERVGELLSRCIDDRDRRTKVYRVEDIESIFPELKEPKDELTWLTKYIEEEAYSLSMDIRDNEDRIKLKKLQKALAWLEKQGKDATKDWTSPDDRQDDKINEDFRNLHKELVNRIAEWCKEHNVIIDEFSLGADGFAESCKYGEWVSATDSSFSCRKFSEEYKKAFWDMDRSFSKEDYDRIEQESRIPYLYSM